MRETGRSIRREVAPGAKKIRETSAPESPLIRRRSAGWDSPGVSKIVKSAKAEPQTDLTLGGNARVIVRSPAHSQVDISGFGSFFRAGKVHVKDSAGVVSASHCQLTNKDHYHIRRASVSMEPLYRLSNAAKEALVRLRDDPADSAAIRRFQRELRPLASKEPNKGSPQASRRVAANRQVTIEGCVDVQTGDGSVMHKTNKYVAEVTELPLVDLLVEDRDLVKAFARAIHEPESGSANTSFYRHVAKAAGQVDELTRLAQAPDLDQVPDAGLFSFFGFASVHDATAVMIGCGNRLDVRTKIDLPGLRKGDVLAELKKLPREELPSIKVESDPSQPLDWSQKSQRRGRSL